MRSIVITLILLKTIFLPQTSCCAVNTFEDATLLLKIGSERQILQFTGCVGPSEQFENVFEIISKRLEFIPVLYDSSFTDLSSLDSIYLLFNGIKRVDSGAFKNMSSLQIISLEHNNIEVIDKGLFVELPRLKALLLNYNKIKRVDPQAFTNLPELSSLYLPANEVPEWIRQSFEGSPNIRILQLWYNNIDSLQSNSFNQTRKVEELYLNQNWISFVHVNAFRGLSKLKILDISRNNLLVFPNNIFASSPGLSELYLNTNNFTYIPINTLENSASLKTLSIQNNPLQCHCMTKVMKWVKTNNINLAQYCVLEANPVCVSIEENCVESEGPNAKEIRKIFYKHYEEPSPENGCVGWYQGYKEKSFYEAYLKDNKYIF